MSALDWVMSTKIGSSRWMLASAVVWPAVTSAPVVTRERPMRPVIGAGTVVYFRLMRAVSRAALFCATWARDCFAAASASV